MYTGGGEIGSSGLQRQNGYVYEEFLREFRGERGMKIYREMSDNDPVVGAVLFAIDMLMRQVPWRVEPGSPNPEDVKIAHFLETCLNDMSHTWPDFISEVMSMLSFGWSWFEIVYKIRDGFKTEDGEISESSFPNLSPSTPQSRSQGTGMSGGPGIGYSPNPTETRETGASSQYDDGKIGWRKIAIRAQESLYKWEFDNEGGVNALLQRPWPDYDERRIPLSRSLLFRTMIRKGNPEGKSVLRTAYRAWYFKNRLETIEGIGVERDLAGLPVAWVPAKWLTGETLSAAESAALTAIKKMVVRIRRDEQEGVVFPLAYDKQGHKVYDLTLLSSGGSRQFDTGKIIERYDQRIAMTVLADFILLGHQKVGSFALSNDKTNLFSLALGAWLDLIQEVLNRYAVPRLLRLNAFPRLLQKDVKPPRIMHGDVETPDLAELGDYITKLAGTGFPLFPNKALETYLLRAANFPEPSEDEVAEREAQAAMTPDDLGPGAVDDYGNPIDTSSNDGSEGTGDGSRPDISHQDVGNALAASESEYPINEENMSLEEALAARGSFMLRNPNAEIAELFVRI